MVLLIKWQETNSPISLSTNCLTAVSLHCVVLIREVSEILCLPSGLLVIFYPCFISTIPKMLKSRKYRSLLNIRLKRRGEGAQDERQGEAERGKDEWPALPAQTHG